MRVERRLRLDGPVNFRDIGGYSTADGRSVRWGRVFRSDSLETLTPLEKDILFAIAKGLSNAEVGEVVHLDRRTVRTHLGHIYDKLGVTGHVAAVVEAMRALSSSPSLTPVNGSRSDASANGNDVALCTPSAVGVAQRALRSMRGKAQRLYHARIARRAAYRRSGATMLARHSCVYGFGARVRRRSRS